MDLSQRDVESSMESRESIKELLDQASRVSRPEDGASRVLLVFAQMATGACDWLDGELRVELVETDDITVIECMTDLGAGFRERVFAPIVMKAPIEEFRRATNVAEMIAPLVVKSSRGRRLILVAEPQMDAPSVLAPAVEIGNENLFLQTSSAMREGSGRPNLSRSSAAMRAVAAVAVPAPAPMPSFTATEIAAAADGDRRASSDDAEPLSVEFPPESVTASRTKIPAGPGVPPPPPIVDAKKLDSSRPATKKPRRSGRLDPNV